MSLIEAWPVRNKTLHSGSVAVIWTAASMPFIAPNVMSESRRLG